MTRTLSLLCAPCGLKQLVTQPLQSCRASSALPRAVHVIAKRSGGHGLYCTLSPRSGQSHETRIQDFGGWVISSLLSSKDIRTSLLNFLRRLRINARTPIYNKAIRIQARWLSDQRDGEKGQNETASEKVGHARYVAKKDAASA